MGSFMKKIVIMSLLATILMAEGTDINATKKLDSNSTVMKDINTTKKIKSPNVYSALGDVIYNNIDNIVKLKEIDIFKSFTQKINQYSHDVDKAKAIGFDIESGSENVNQAKYLETLRTLSKENDYFVRSVRSAYKASVKKQDSELFIEVVNSGLLDTDHNREEIVEYYVSHSDDINATGVIQRYLDEDAKLKSKKSSYNYERSKRLRQEAKIKRIRENDKKKQAKLEKELAEEVKQKKTKIRENQKKELFN